MNYQNCTVNTTNQKIVVKENKSTFCILNTNGNQIEKIQVDGCLLDNRVEKCDWLFFVPHSNQALYVELKGSDISKAGQQLESTIMATANRFENCIKNCYVTTSKVPKYGSPVQKLQIMLKRKYGATLKVKNNILEVSI